MTQHPASTVADIGAAGVIVTSLMGWLPPIAAALGIIWYCILIYDRFLGKKNKN